MIRPNIRRSGMVSRTLVSLTVLSLLVLSLGPASLLAANTRDIFFGSPNVVDQDGNPVSGTLEFSGVTVGGNTYVELEIRNDGGQPVNFVKWAAGTYADDLAYNPDFPEPDRPSLGGSTIELLIPSDGCTPAGPESVLCDIGTLAPGASRTYKIVLTPPDGSSPYDVAVWFTASWAEGWSTTGANADYTFAEGMFTVETADCDTPASSWFLPGQAVELTVGDGANCQSASLSSQALGGILGGPGSLGIDANFAAGCPAGYSCYGSTVEAVISEGLPVAGGVQWTVKWFGIKSLKGVIHFHDNYDPDDPTTYTVIPFMKKFQCSAQRTTNCWVSTESSKGNADPLTFEAVFVTPNNGRAGGFI